MIDTNGSTECWSCTQFLAVDEVRDNDGYCPLCNAELISEPDYDDEIHDD